MNALLTSLLKQDGGYHFGEPWRHAEQSMGFVVPILSTKKGKRNYVTLDEVKDSKAIHISDSGNISRIKVKSSSNKPIFIRIGSIMKGNGTQSRGVEASIVVMPESQIEDLPKVDIKPTHKIPLREIEVPVRCVHASHPISGGSSMSYSMGAPREVDTSFLSKSGQHDAWNSVQISSSRLYRFRSSSIDTHENLSTPGMSDNLVDNIQTIAKFKGEVLDAIKNLPVLEDQVGVVIFDKSNVVGLEMFDHQDSWLAFQTMVIDKYSDILVKKNEGEMFELKKERIPKKVESFITTLLDRQDELVFEDSGTKTFSFTAKDTVGEYTTIKDAVIHLLAVRNEGIEKKRKETQPQRFETQPFPFYGSNINQYDSGVR